MHQVAERREMRRVSTVGEGWSHLWSQCEKAVDGVMQERGLRGDMSVPNWSEQGLPTGTGPSMGLGAQKREDE